MSFKKIRVRHSEQMDMEEYWDSSGDLILPIPARTVCMNESVTRGENPNRQILGIASETFSQRTQRKRQISRVGWRWVSAARSLLFPKS